MRTAKLFNNGKSQAVHLPKEFRFDGNEVIIKKSGNAVVLLPANHSWDVLTNSLNKFSDNFMEDRNQPAPQNRELNE